MRESIMSQLRPDNLEVSIVGDIDASEVNLDHCYLPAAIILPTAGHCSHRGLVVSLASANDHPFRGFQVEAEVLRYLGTVARREQPAQLSERPIQVLSPPREERHVRWHLQASRIPCCTRTSGC